METNIIERARELAEGLLFATALETDAADLVPKSHLDALAEEGLYGLPGPVEYGGLGADFPTMCEVVETLASGCLTTTFVWAQHLSPVFMIAASKSEPLRERWLRRLCAGEVRGGIALSAFRPDRPHLRAERVDGGWMFEGVAPWVTGWGRNDVLLTSALSEDGTMVRALVDSVAGPTLTARPLALVAANASGTVELTFVRHLVSADRVVTEEPYVPPPVYDGGGRLNGSLSLGVARRCCAMLGPSPLDGELSERRTQLDVATGETMAEARAAASELAFRASGALMVGSGSGALLRSHHAQRLARESLFLLTFGTRPAIKDALLRRFGAAVR